jgi:NAD(P)-dependent dehydrogenase (short-subunit alcohol dehydrogenase family)
VGLKLKSLPPSFRALILGSSGAIGAALQKHLEKSPYCETVVGLHRHSQPALDFNNEQSIAIAAQEIAERGPFHLIVNAVGILHDNDFRPEKKLDELNYNQLIATFTANTFGPALVLRHFSKLLATDGSVMAHLSAKVGSIDDNRLGGWYSYRASKAALNMLIKTASLELKRRLRKTALVAIHPGTVASALSRPFKGDTLGRTPETAAAEILAVLQELSPADTGKFISYNGEELPW